MLSLTKGDGTAQPSRQWHVAIGWDCGQERSRWMDYAIKETINELLYGGLLNISEIQDRIYGYKFFFANLGSEERPNMDHGKVLSEAFFDGIIYHAVGLCSNSEKEDDKGGRGYVVKNNM
jgi:hypothetical protein